MLYVFCAMAVATGFAGLAVVGGVIAIMPWEIVFEGAARNTLTFLTVAAAGSILFAMVPISLTAIVAGMIGLRFVWRDEDAAGKSHAPRHETGMPKAPTLDDILIKPDASDETAQQKGPASTKPAEPSLKPRDAE